MCITALRIEQTYSYLNIILFIFDNNYTNMYIILNMLTWSHIFNRYVTKQIQEITFLIDISFLVMYL